MTENSDWQDAIGVFEPLDLGIEAALQRGADHDALRLAFDGALRTVDLLAGDDRGENGCTAVHGVWVELTRLPLTAQCDGTLVEGGAYVTLQYQRYELTRDEADALAGSLRGQLGDSGDEHIGRAEIDERRSRSAE